MDKAFSPKTLALHWGCSKRHVLNKIESGFIKNWFTIGENRLNPKTGKIQRGDIRIPAWEVKRIEDLRFIENTGASSGEKTEKQNDPPYIQRIAPKQSEHSRSI